MVLTKSLIISFLLCSTLIAQQDGLARLMEGNKRYVQDALQNPNRTSERRESLTSKQEPFAVIIGCSDSRVSPEIIFDQGVGDLFVVRVAGNVVGPLELESILYATSILHASTLLVLGHESCGAVNAVVQNSIENIEAIAALIQPAIREAKKTNPPNLLEASIQTNAINMKNYLLSTPTLQKLVMDKQLRIYAGYYDLQTGAVSILKK